MTDSRRSALKKIGVSTAWTAPVVQSIVLPVHAQTSEQPPSMCVESDIPGTWSANVDFLLFIDGTGQIIDRDQGRLADLSWQLDSPKLTIIEIFDTGVRIPNDYVMASDCKSFSLGNLTFVKQ